jgi:uncharacterized protein DUF1360
VNLAWTTQPLALLINILVAYRLTRLWVDDMLPPIPRVRWAIETWAFARQQRRDLAAREADMRDPAHLAEVDEAGKRALRGGYQAAHVIGPRERAEEQRIHRSGGQPSLVYLIQCHWCAGFWIGLAVFLAASLLPAVAWTVLAVPLALSATTGLIAGRAEGNG